MELSVENSPQAASKARSISFSIPVSSIRGEEDSPREAGPSPSALAAMEL